MLIAYIDLETDRNNHHILDMGAICGQQHIHTTHLPELLNTIQAADFLCGHHFLHHDFPHLQTHLGATQLPRTRYDCPLLLSPLLFPARLYHALDKDYKTQFAESNNPLTDCLIARDLLDDFEHTHPKNKYVSDWQSFVQESALENFDRNHQAVVQVSTIHKAKGREYDDVFVYLNRAACQTDEQKRLLYVAFSRAKSHLCIFANHADLQKMCCDVGAEIPFYRGEVITPARELALYLNHGDVNLGRFAECARAIRALQAGDTLLANGEKCCDLSGNAVLYFSKKCREKLTHYHKLHYQISHAEVNFIVLWHNKDTDETCRIVLPIVYLRK